MFFFLAVDTLQMGSSARMRGDPILWGDTSIQMARMAQLSSHGPDPSLSGKLFYSLPCGEPRGGHKKFSHIWLSTKLQFIYSRKKNKEIPLKT